jgi:hypothetical protein
MELVLVQILNGLQYGLLIFLAASGLTLVFGILGVINLSHGSFYMLGAYLSLTLTSWLGDIFLALAATRVPVRRSDRMAIHPPSLCARSLATGSADLRINSNLQRATADSLGHADAERAYTLLSRRERQTN